ncbi:MAG: efflux RND transporter periplasmic adaptor subunit [Archangium sp.]|nr:efflux RND transporter periplasmic adaptor subunit [Archangium sp.]
MKNALLSAVLLSTLAACSCKSGKDAEAVKEEAHHDDAEGHDELPRQVKLADAEARRAGIKTAPVKRGALASTLSLTGEIVAEPDRTARLSSATPGRLEQVLFNEGSTVKRGDVMATVRVPDVGRLRGAYAAAGSRARAARTNAARLAELKASGLGSEQALVDAEADAKAQEAELHALGEQLSAIGVNADSGGGFIVALRAPLSGVVVSRDAVVGQPITPEAVLATVVDLSEVWFLGRIFEKDLTRLKAGANAEIELNAFPKEHFHGAVDYVSQQIDPAARTLTARIRVSNADLRLRLGLFGRAHVEQGDASTVTPQLVVPRDAIVDVGGKSVVFIKAADGDFVMHEVTVGDSAMDDVQILSGVSEGEEVVVSGVFTLKSLLLKSTLAEDE